MIDRTATVMAIAVIVMLGSMIPAVHAQEKIAAPESAPAVQNEKDDSQNAKPAKIDRNQARENRRERRRDQRIDRRKIRR